MPEKPLWRCARCGREFRTRNQWHSCVNYSVESHFENTRPELREAFDFLLGELGELGPVRVDAVKTSVNIAARAHFAGVKPLQDSLRIGFVLDRTLDHPRVLRSEKISSTQYSHVVKISGIDDIDEQLLGWMAEAYALKSW